MGGMWQNYKTRKGNTASRLIAVFNILPTSLENEAQSSIRSITMSNSTSTPSPFQIDYDLADSIGMDCAQMWRDHVPGDHITATSCAAWRAICYAYFVNDYQDHENFLGLLKAWEEGFDQANKRATGDRA